VGTAALGPVERSSTAGLRQSNLWLCGCPALVALFAVGRACTPPAASYNQ
jgi:hypothetical protein